MKRINKIFKVFFSGIVMALLFCGGCLKDTGEKTAAPGEAREVFAFSGIITKHTVWDGIIVVEDDILVPAGLSLTIRPGTKIIIKEKDTSRNEPLFLSPYNEILVRGKITAEGREKEPVVFSGEGKSGDGIFWAGIILDNAEEGTFNFCEFYNAFTGIDSIKSSPVVNKCTFSKNRFALISSGEASCPKITKNIIRGNFAGFYGIFFSRGELDGNIIEDNEEEGVFTGKKSDIILKINDIKKNKYDVRHE